MEQPQQQQRPPQPPQQPQQPPQQPQQQQQQQPQQQQQQQTWNQQTYGAYGQPPQAAGAAAWQAASAMASYGQPQMMNYPGYGQVLQQQQQAISQNAGGTEQPNAIPAASTPSFGAQPMSYGAKPAGKVGL